MHHRSVSTGRILTMERDLMVSDYGVQGGYSSGVGGQHAQPRAMTRKLRELKARRESLEQRRAELALEVEDLTLRREELKLHKQLSRRARLSHIR